jgi:hypothetical protein
MGYLLLGMLEFYSTSRDFRLFDLNIPALNTQILRFPRLDVKD